MPTESSDTIPALETFFCEHTDETVKNVHKVENCSGDQCTIHNRSDHAMREFPQHWTYKCMMRVCPHYLEHPDPDETPNTYSKYMLSHAKQCDGCCDGLDWLENEKALNKAMTEWEEEKRQLFNKNRRIEESNNRRIEGYEEYLDTAESAILAAILAAKSAEIDHLT